jgi:hypothetical protein
MPAQRRGDDVIVTVAAGPGGDEAIRDFYRWLRSDVDVARNAEVALADTGAGDGAMGPLEIINVILSNATALSSLAIAYANWRRSRAESADTAARLRFSTQDVRIELSDASPEAIDSLGRLVGEARRPVNGPPESSR